MISAVTQLLGSVGGLATSYLDGKTAVQKAEAQIRMKEATGDIDWDLAAIRATQGSWKDEWILLLFSIPLILAFLPFEWANAAVANGFAALDSMPQWYSYTLGVIVASSFAVRSATKFFGK